MERLIIKGKHGLDCNVEHPEYEWLFCVLKKGHDGLHQDSRGEKFSEK